jgi:hypothetical protein
MTQKGCGNRSSNSQGTTLSKREQFTLIFLSISQQYHVNMHKSNSNIHDLNKFPSLTGYNLAISILQNPPVILIQHFAQIQNIIIMNIQCIGTYLCIVQNGVPVDQIIKLRKTTSRVPFSATTKRLLTADIFETQN